MNSKLTHHRPTPPPSAADETTAVAHRSGVVPPAEPVVSTGLFLLGIALAINTLLGPLVFDVFDYPLSDTLINETIGLEAVSLFLVAPWCVAAGVLVRKRPSVGAVVALAPTAYVVYMFVQYIAGIPYAEYRPQVALHLALFVLAGVIFVAAWRTARRTPVELSDRDRSVWSIVLAVFGLFVLSRWLEAVLGMTQHSAVPDGYAQDLGMHWTILLLDLGVMVPATAATVVALRRGVRWAGTALVALVGWFALVPPSVFAMALTKHINDDPNAASADTVVFAAAAAVSAAVALTLYRSLFRRQAARTMTASPCSVAVRPNGSTSARTSSGDQHR